MSIIDDKTINAGCIAAVGALVIFAAAMFAVGFAIGRMTA